MSSPLVKNPVFQQLAAFRQGRVSDVVPGNGQQIEGSERRRDGFNRLGQAEALAGAGPGAHPLS
ncbi:hypothetical protein J7I89_24605 [Arthrobacter sp. ISL-5]|nr:hypothetical protein [Arthrobacter sp. ISL-5]